MTDRPSETIWLYALAGATSLAAAIFLLVPRAPQSRPPHLPQLAAYVATHPADWFGIREITDEALESESADPLRLWTAAFKAATALAPSRHEPRVAFVRAGLTHWMELNAADRRTVLAAAAPLLHDPETFDRVAEPLFRLNGDLDYLRRNRPKGLPSLALLMSLAASADRLDDYRAMRTELAAERRALFDRERATTSPNDLLTFLPATIRITDEPLVVALLDALRKRPLDSDPGKPEIIDTLVDYTLRHGLQPLDGLELLIGLPHSASEPTRARLALYFERPEIADGILLSTTIVDPTKWSAYYLERALYERNRNNGPGSALYESKAVASRPAVLPWKGLCSSNEVCSGGGTSVMRSGAPLQIQIAFQPSSPDAVPQVELYVNDALALDSAVSSLQTITVAPASVGLHPIDLIVVNRFTSDGRERRLRIVAPLP